MIPDFRKLGYNLMAITMFRLKPIHGQELENLQKASRELNDQTRRPFLLVMDGMGMGKHLYQFHSTETTVNMLHI